MPAAVVDELGLMRKDSEYPNKCEADMRKARNNQVPGGGPSNKQQVEKQSTGHSLAILASAYYIRRVFAHCVDWSCSWYDKRRLPHLSGGGGGWCAHLFHTILEPPLK